MVGSEKYAIEARLDATTARVFRFELRSNYAGFVVRRFQCRSRRARRSRRAALAGTHHVQRAGARGVAAHIKTWGFTDAFRLHTEAGGKFTWWDYRAGAFRRNLGLRIDHIWITDPLVSRNVRTWIDIEPRTWEKPSDHAPVIAEFS